MKITTQNHSKWYIYRVSSRGEAHTTCGHKAMVRGRVWVPPPMQSEAKNVQKYLEVFVVLKLAISWGGGEAGSIWGGS